MLYYFIALLYQLNPLTINLYLDMTGENEGRGGSQKE